MKGETANDRGSALDPDRLKYVTENFAALQGLTFVALGTMFLLSEIEDIWNVPHWLPLMTALCLLFTFRYIPRYYERRFGEVEPKIPTNKQALIFVLVMLVLLIWGRRLDVILSDWENRIHLMISDPVGQTNLSPLALWIFAFYTSLRSRLGRAEPYGPYFFGLGMIACFIVAFYPLWDPVARQLLLWRTLNASSVVLSFIAWPLPTHITLVRLFPTLPV